MAKVWLGKTRTIRMMGLALSAGLTAVMLVLVVWSPHWLQRLENLSLDLRFKLRGERSPGHEVVIVVVDEESIKEIGRWPWSRDRQGQVVANVAADGAKVIGLDVIYSEAEVTEFLKSLREVIDVADAPGSASPALQDLLRQKLAQADTDQQFVQSLRQASNVVLGLALLVPETGAVAKEQSKSVKVPDYLKRNQFMLVREIRSGEALEPLRANDSHPPLKAFADEAISLGSVYSLPDVDGVTRHEYLAIRYGSGDDYYPSLALEVARQYLGLPRDRVSLTLGEGVRLDKILVPTDQQARMLIDHVGPEQSFKYVSASKVIRRQFHPGTFKDKAVLFGTAALGAYDQKTTPFSANFPGVEKNATVVENIIHQHFVERSVWAGTLDAGLTLLFGLGLGATLPRLRALPGAAVASGLFVGYAAIAQYYFAYQGVWLGVVYPLGTVVLSFVSITVLRFMTEEKQAKEVRQMFSSYVSPRIVEELIKDPTKAKLGGQRKELTMLFSDVAGFTSFSEKHSAEEVVAQLNEYLGAMTEVIFKWNGTLDKFVGDAIVVFWGAPLDQPNHVELAIKCALHMRKRLEQLREKWKAEGKFLLDNGIGINTGAAVVGNIGAEGKKMDYTMIGDHVNLAARAEGLTRTFKTSIVITEYTATALTEIIDDSPEGDNAGRLGHVLLRKLRAVKVKGKDQPVVIYSLESLGREEQSRIIEEVSDEVLEMHEK
jgi:adenylate cyclase